MNMSPDIRSTRRFFLGQLALLLPAAFLGRAAGRNLLQADMSDEEIFLEAMLLANMRGFSSGPVGHAVAAFGQHFTGTPYKGHTLEAPGEERLVVNLREFDCLTFVENMLALARSHKSGKRGFEDFQKQLTTIRYTGGIIKGYPSRLHYFSTWIRDNIQKGIVQDITRELGGSAYTKTINFMTTHRTSYRQLDRAEFVQQIRREERLLSGSPHYHIPSDHIGGIQNRLQSGDIIGTTTTMVGMDVSHTGMVLRLGSVARFMHASLSGKKVLISSGPLAEYVAGIPSHTGIMVVRPLEPA